MAVRIRPAIDHWSDSTSAARRLMPRTTPALRHGLAARPARFQAAGRMHGPLWEYEFNRGGSVNPYAVAAENGGAKIDRSAAV